MESCITKSESSLQSLALQSFLQSLQKEQWQEVRLGDTCLSIDYGYTTSATALNTGVKFLRITDIVPELIDWDSVPYCEIDFDKITKYLLGVGDIVIARTGATTGCNKIIKSNHNQSVFASYLIRCKFNLKLVNPNFVFYNLQSLSWKGFVAGVIGGSAQPNANAKQFSNFTFKLPPLETQEKIAEILSSFDNKIDLLHRQNKTLESLALTLFRHYFIDNPKRDEWELGKLGEEFNFVMGVSPKGSSYNEQQKGVPMFQGNADFGFRFPTNRIYTDEPKKFAEKFDTLVSVRAPVGAVNMAQENCCIGRGLSAFRHDNKNLYSYTFYKMKLLSKEFEQFNDKGTIFGAISKGDFEGIDVWIPPLEYVVKINQELKTIDDKIYNNSKQIQNLQKMRDVLLKAIFA